MKIKLNRKPFHYTLGQRGEREACDALEKKRYQIIERNYRCLIGEIDIIARKDRRIFFFEVKTRKSEHFGRPEEAVDLRKQKKIIQVSKYYLKKTKQTEEPIGYGVVGILWKEDQKPEITLFENAFDAEVEP